MQTNPERFKWFDQARFGMFIHWGLYSLLGRGEWVRYTEGIAPEEYRALAQRFDPRRYDPRDWARIAKAAGMKYMVLTAKHHDGFCLFDSQYTSFTAPKTAARRDLVAEYAAACREAGLGVGLYFSVKDWDFPAYFRGPENDPDGWAELVEHFHRQTIELMSNYGTIDVLFYDCSDDANFRGGWGGQTKDIWRSEELNARVRGLQPGILINNRSGMAEDYSTPEGEILMAVGDMQRTYETCMTMNEHWGYCPGDTRWKSVGQLVDQLVACAARNCNLLLNVGPDSDGLIPAPSVERLLEAGQWLSQFGDAIYGTERLLPNWWDFHSCGRITTRGDKAWAVIQSWNPEGEIAIAQLANQVLGAGLLPGRQPLQVVREGRRIRILGLPRHPISPLANVVELQLDGPAAAQFHY